eukprot:5953276-Amphidinium_carterae.1
MACHWLLRWYARAQPFANQAHNIQVPQPFWARGVRLFSSCRETCSLGIVFAHFTMNVQYILFKRNCAVP